MRGLLLLLLALPAAAATSSTSPPGPLMSLLQVVIGLAIVLLAIVGVAWLFRRLSGGMLPGSHRLRVVSGLMVGQRERVVIVELEGEWLVLGVTTQAVNLLTRLPRPDDADDAAATPGEPFARWLKKALNASRPPSGPSAS
ncbi:flagellar biosynthetic protein FliO [Pseudogulbenkiania ferrooxidans]|uniref:Flagellar protein n=1 Tax=Pseudogulbenkiania ferrooxidans 2002 TaxID=279714 RepID=B9Z792_9NEIS|nr:flagellar biosynthetic protein FliO [Pseudogulbenkiania ferrooxidans]EEG07407.1 flagellar biosynthesis protein FliO [Pseudogulbenkiania ferrooxidans 2002]